MLDFRCSPRANEAKTVRILAIVDEEWKEKAIQNILSS